MKDKKAQMEIMGMMIIVIILVIAALFYVKFVVLQPKKEGASTLVQEQAYNLMNAVLNVKVCDNNVSVRDAIKACKEGGYLCGEDSACIYIGEEIKTIVSMSMPKDYADYEFIAGKPVSSGCEQPFLDVKSKECKYGVTSPRYINVEAEYCTLFKLCRSNIK